MITPEELLNKLTDKLIEIALEPEKRKAFELSYALDSTHEATIRYSQNVPTISNIEAYTLASYYCNLLCFPHSEDSEISSLKKLLAELDTISNGYDIISSHITALLRNNYEISCDYQSEFTFCRLYIKEKCNLFSGVSLDDLEWFMALLRQNKDCENLVSTVDNIVAYIASSDNPETFIYESQEEYDAAMKTYSKSLTEYVEIKLNEIPEELKFMKDAILQAYKLYNPSSESFVRMTRIYSRKNDFDHIYTRAENGYSKYQKFIATAYRTGDGVQVNQRLADFWEMAANNH